MVVYLLQWAGHRPARNVRQRSAER